MARRPTYSKPRRRSQPDIAKDTGDTLRSGVAGLLRASKKRRKLTSLQKLQRKARRSALAFLKRKGLAPKGQSASAKRRAVAKYRAVIKGEETAYKLPADFPKQALRDLKKSGYKVARGKLILPRGQYSRKGKVYAKPVGKRAGALVEARPLTSNYEAEIEAAFASLKDGDWIAFSIYGNNSYSVYQSAYGMLRDLTGLYSGVDLSQAGVLTIFRVKNTDAYLKDATARRFASEERQREKRRVARAGMRVRKRA